MEWGDAWGTSSWDTAARAAEAHKVLGVTSVGFVIKQDKVGISLCQGFDANGNPAGQHFIPTGMITKIKKVKY